MNETLQIWLFGGSYALFGGLALFALNLNNRLIRFETMLELWGRKAAKLLHSPSNHLGMDELIDKYLDRNYELTWDEWTQWLALCIAVEQDDSKTPSERLLAAGMGTICEHKLHMLPRQKRYKKSDA